MTRLEALVVIIRDVQINHPTRNSFNRASRACKALDLSPKETNEILYRLAYVDRDGIVYAVYDTSKEEERL